MSAPMTPVEVLEKHLRANPEGVTREQAARLLGVSDRAARQAIEDTIVAGRLPVICDRGETGQQEGRYRIAGVDEPHLVNRELDQLISRGLSNLRRAKGLRTAYQQAHQAGSLFLANVPEPDTILQQGAPNATKQATSQG